MRVHLKNQLLTHIIHMMQNKQTTNEYDAGMGEDTEKTVNEIEEINNKWIDTGSSFLDYCIKEGIPSGKISFVAGKSRSVGKSLSAKKILIEWKKTHRIMKLTRYFNNLDNK